MGNPYSPRTPAGVPIELPVKRLRRVGADDQEVAEARARWRGLTGDERAETAEALAALTDEELGEEIMAGRRGDPYPDALLGVPGGAGSPALSAVPGERGAGWSDGAAGGSRGSDGHTGADPGLVAGSVQEVLARVSGDPSLAQAAIRAEEAGKGRKGLLRDLRRLAG